ncbi:MAG: spore cortex-lytic enzyme [Clostridia bacterium]|nr:spore cortex-lytic enzyme [Clostridia bacterium]
MERRQVRRKRWLAGAIALLLLAALALPAVADAVLKKGATGEDVKLVQKKLKQWGYYSGAVDGIFGSQTEAAVKYFQRKNGLVADGIVGKKTAAALGISLSGGSSTATANTDSEVYLLAQCIHGEARGEPYKGQVAVGAVILNRVRSSQFPNTIAGVIYQKGAFSVVADGQINMDPGESALKAAKDALNGWDPTGGCLYYYNPKKTSNAWILSRPIVLRIGEHVFCK